MKHTISEEREEEIINILEDYAIKAKKREYYKNKIIECERSKRDISNVTIESYKSKISKLDEEYDFDLLKIGIETLNEDESKIFKYRYIEGWSAVKISIEFNFCDSTVYRRLKDIYAKLDVFVD